MRFTEFIKGPAPKQTKTQFTEMELAIMEGGGSLEPAVELPVVKRQSALSQAMGEAEMGTAYARNISQEFRKLGYKKIGSGADSTVFAKEAGYVIKILMPEDPGSRAVEVFKKFYEFCLQHQDLKCLPVINEYNTIDVLDKEYIQIDMERLFPIRKNTFSEAMVWYLSDYVSNDIAWPAVKAELSNPDKWEESHWPRQADKIANKVKNLTADQEQTWSELYSVMSMLFKTGRINKLGWDLHTENVMQRKNGDLVIIDPWFADNTLLESNLEEKWSQKYKKSINCSNPKGFSQRAHCQGRKKNEGVEANLNTKYSLKNMFGDVKSLDNLSLEQLNKAMDGRVRLVGRKFRSQEGRSFRYDVKLANGEWYIMHVVYVHGLIDAWLTDEENNKIPLSKFKAKGVAEGIDIGQEWMSDTELDDYVPIQLQDEWRELLGFDEEGNPHPLWVNMTGDYEPNSNDPQHRAWMVKVANKWFAMKKIPNVKFYDVRDIDDELEWLVQIGQQGVAENFADGKVKGKSRPGRVKRAGASCDGSVTDLRAKAKNASGEKSKMYHWCANMKSGKK